MQNDHNRRATGMHNETTRLLGLTGLAVVRVDDATTRQAGGAPDHR
jgi:hypothetical protein